MQFESYTRLVETRYGKMLANEHDRYVGQSLIKYGEFSEHEMEMFRRLLRPRDNLIEVGANIGALTVPLAQEVGPRGRVIAIEPQRICFQMLCANLALNSITNTRALWMGASDRLGTILVPWLDPTLDNNFGGLSLEGIAHGETVQRYPVDSLMSLLTFAHHVHFVKIDVEGMELEVLRGMRTLVQNHRPLIYVENDREAKAQALIRYCAEDLEYDLWWHAPPLFNEKNYRRSKENVFGEVVSLNMVGVPREARSAWEGVITTAPYTHPVDVPWATPKL